MDEQLAMYLDFRKHIDTLCFNDIKNDVGDGYIEIKTDDGDVAGFMIVETVTGYVDAIYIKPEHRRKGLARRAVMDYLLKGSRIRQFHIVNRNKDAFEFWRSLFFLDEAAGPVDTLCKVIRLRK